MEISYIILSILVSLGVSLVILYVVYRFLKRYFAQFTGGDLFIDPIKQKASRKSAQVRTAKAQAKILESGKKKVVSNLGNVIPGADQLVKILVRLGLNEMEIFALALNPQVQTGVLRLLSIFGGGAEALTGLFNRGGDKKKKGSGLIS